MATNPANGRIARLHPFVGSASDRLFGLDARSQSLNGLQGRINSFRAGLGTPHLLLLHELMEKFLHLGITLHALSPHACLRRIRPLFLVHFGPF